jgi:CHAT domain-containing protein
MIFLRDSSTASETNQLQELLNHESHLKNCSYQNDSTHAFLFQRIGFMYYALHDYEKAVTFTQRAISIITSNADKPDINKKRAIKCYRNLQTYYDSLKQTANKNKASDSCIAISIRLGTVDNDITIGGIAERTKYLNYIGDYQRCIQYAELGMSVSRRYGLDTSGNTATIFVSYINAFIFLGQYEKAQELLKLKIQEFVKQKKVNYLGGMYDLLAVTYKEQGKYQEAILFFLKSYKYNLQVKYDVGCSESLNTLGFLYFDKLHLNNKALAYYNQALKYADSLESLNILDNVANLYVSKNQFSSAQHYFQKAFDQIKPGINESNLLRQWQEYSNVNLSEYVTNLILDKADGYLLQYRYEKKINTLEEALHIYKTADQLLDKMKMEQLQTGLFWRSHIRRLYEHAIEASYLKNSQEDAFYFFEKSRSVLLQDQLNQMSRISNEDILKQAEIKRKILLQEREKSTTYPSSKRYTDLQNELFTNNQKLIQLQQIIKQKNPLYYQSFLDTTMITLHEVKKDLLKDPQALLELFEGDSAVYSLLITSSKTYFDKISKTDFDTTTTAYIGYISNQSLLNSRFAEYTKTANHLYQLIFRENILPGVRLIVSPNGHYFPFEALVTNVSNPSSPVYFLNDHAVSYTYSARYLQNNFVPSSVNYTGDFMGMAPLQFKPGLKLSSLAGSNTSLNKIGEYFAGSKLFVDKDATKGSFQRQFPDYRIVQLYTHSSGSSDNMEPVIYFQDSALYLSELILDKKPVTQLIVLSACETAKGTLYAGEGVFSFNRAFAALGIPSAVSNLWSIDNVATYKLTELFSKYLSQGLPLDIALQKAKLEYIGSGDRENRSPYYWAAPILVGKTDPIILDKPFVWKYVIAGIGLAGFAFIGWKKIKKRNSLSQFRV